MALKVTTHLKKIDSLVLAEYITFKVGKLSHLKLQKLVYYSQAYHLAYFGQPLIEDEFEAWVHGPVSRKIFNSLKDFSLLYDDLVYIQSKGEVSPDKKIAELTEDQIDLIDSIIEEFGTLSGQQLENLSHSEFPWIEARAGYGPAEKCSKVINIETMTAFYKTQIYGKV